ncbi:hypothetical protein B9Z55_007509 [Caenorhabditis nigoni]|uniref:Uncharacterized protein n=2 Tax=Caenorhabditis nigoni TaxID=1611254 RepID=A0A2G5V9Z4_9PELO|nr:hypothetical protein B9Z55_007509 [Caenorhabditis nigoni]
MSELILVDFGSRTTTLKQTASRRRRPLQTSAKSRALEREVCLLQPYQLIDGRENDHFSHTLKGHGELLFDQKLLAAKKMSEEKMEKNQKGREDSFKDTDTSLSSSTSSTTNGLKSEQNSSASTSIALTVDNPLLTDSSHTEATGKINISEDEIPTEQDLIASKKWGRDLHEANLRYQCVNRIHTLEANVDKQNELQKVKHEHIQKISRLIVRFYEIDRQAKASNDKKIEIGNELIDKRREKIEVEEEVDRYLKEVTDNRNDIDKLADITKKLSESVEKLRIITKSVMILQEKYNPIAKSHKELQANCEEITVEIEREREILAQLKQNEQLVHVLMGFIAPKYMDGDPMNLETLENIINKLCDVPFIKMDEFTPSEMDLLRNVIREDFNDFKKAIFHQICSTTKGNFKLRANLSWSP